MKARIVASAAVLAAGLFGSGAAYADLIFIGSWEVDDGPDWPTVPAAYTGQEAAALIFGGSAGEYVISTVSAIAPDVNFMAWVSTWGGACGDAFPCGTTVAQDFKVTTAGLYENPGDISAYVNDWAVGAQYTNYAFINRLAEVPEPAPMVLFAAGLAGLGLLSRRQKSKAVGVGDNCDGSLAGIGSGRFVV